MRGFVALRVDCGWWGAVVAAQCAGTVCADPARPAGPFSYSCSCQTTSAEKRSRQERSSSGRTKVGNAGRIFAPGLHECCGLCLLRFSKVVDPHMAKPWFFRMITNGQHGAVRPRSQGCGCATPLNEYCNTMLTEYCNRCAESPLSWECPSHQPAFTPVRGTGDARTSQARAILSSSQQLRDTWHLRGGETRGHSLTEV